MGNMAYTPDGVAMIRPDEDHRPLMSFRHVPVTEEVGELLDHLSEQILATEERAYKRSPASVAKLKDCLGRVLADLAITVETGPHHCRGWLKNGNFYSQSTVPVGRRQAQAVYEGLQKLHLIETVCAGSFDRKRGSGVAETIRPSNEMAELMFAYKIFPTKVHFEWDREAERLETDWLPVVVKELRKPGDWQAPKAKVIPHMFFTAEGQRLAKEQEERNAFIRGFVITGPQLEGWQRIFSGDFRGHGRLYAMPKGDNYQNISPAERLKLKINKVAPVNEIDLTASYLFIALTKRHVDVVERSKELKLTKDDGSLDPYAIPGFDRQHVKKYLSSSFSLGKHIKRWPKGTKSEFPGDLPHVEDLRRGILECYPELTKLDGLSWAELSNTEAQIITSAMDSLRARGIPSYPVHDSLIVPLQATAMAEMYLEQACSNITGYAPLPFQMAREMYVQPMSIEEANQVIEDDEDDIIIAA